jgi:hypothetical protein
MRNVVIPAQDVIESIQSYSYQLNAYVYVVIGIGNIVDGEFVFNVPQQFDSVYIIDKAEVIDPETGQVVSPAINDFTNLMNQYPNGSFSTDDLWPYIDLVRSRR